MKNLTYILMSLCMVALTGCGMTDVWKDWENEGMMNEERLRPSEVKELLCSADGWKMTYENTTFYFQFTKDGAVASDSDESILESATEADYYFDFNGEKVVLLKMSNEGMMKYLKQNQENTFVITDYSDSKITATGKTYGKTMILLPVTTAELQQAK